MIVVHSIRKARKGLTLVELLVVSAVLLVLASISLTAMKGLLRGQKVGQAAITVKQYLQNAQIRALASGRPVAVFMDRVSMVGDSNNPTSQNFTVTRLQFGEVFPAYEGDTEDAAGTFAKVDFNSMNPKPTSRLLQPGNNDDSSADRIIFDLSKVTAAFGNGNPNTGGFVNPGDFIEFRNYKGRFVIEAYARIAATPPATSDLVEVHFFNPPETYASERSRKVSKNEPLHPIYEDSDHAAVEPQPLPIGASNIKFKIFRQPTRSLVGSIVLPRGTCVDLSVSGIGITDNVPDGGSFGLKTIPPSSVGRSDFSRIGLVFNSDGRLAYILDENTRRTNKPRRIPISASSVVYLMVGRSDQVLPGFDGNNGKLAALQHPDPTVNPAGAAELPKSNLMDSENVWVTCNPFTGEVRSAPVAEQTPSDIAQKLLDIQNTAATPISDIIRKSRDFAASGLSNR